MEASKKFQEAGQKLKADLTENEEKKVAVQEAGQNELASIKANPVMAKLYAENTNVGADNLAGQLPALKVHTAGKSQNELANGEEPKNGSFYYAPTKSAFGELEVHILTISKGFYAPGMPDKNGNTTLKFNQIMGGVFLDGGEYCPFIMYFTGSKLKKMWDFGAEASKYKAMGIPMFTLLVKMTTEKQTNDYGYSWIINFEIVKSEEGTPTLIHDPLQFNFLKENVEVVKEMIDSIVLAKESDRLREAEPVIKGEEGELPPPGENPDDLPFD